MSSASKMCSGGATHCSEGLVASSRGGCALPEPILTDWFDRALGKSLGLRASNLRGNTYAYRRNSQLSSVGVLTLSHIRPSDSWPMRPLPPPPGAQRPFCFEPEEGRNNPFHSALTAKPARHRQRMGAEAGTTNNR